jgi:diketogulonate reductase-like aldo/keto reductase
MLRWHLLEGRSATPKPTKPHRAPRMPVVDFELSTDELPAMKALDRGNSAAPPLDPADAEVVELFRTTIPEA